MGDDDDIASALIADAGATPQTLLASQAKLPADTNFDESDDDSIIADLQASANRQAARGKSKGNSKGGGFQTFGLNANLLKAITRKGFTVPTPIQRKTVPLILDRQDVVGMARTGSGKTAAFVLPMIERLKTHSTKIGIRALIMSPSRELALQTLKVTKEFGRGTDLRTTLLVGGDSLEDQFEAIASNPDIVIATPGRFLHVQVEMGLSLSSVQYVVFDEADRLFEMGFAAQLAEVLHALPASRQTLLFSATLPKSLVEFARAGLQEPHLVRLDAESKISQDLQNAFFAVKSAEKEGALLHILHDVIKMPTGDTEAAATSKPEGQPTGKKRKREEHKAGNAGESPTKHSTIVFVATKHHVEYVATLLRHSGYAVSHAYGALDQTARQIQVQNFRSGRSNILVVTDVAARGIDIPVLANVINYDFPSQPKIYIHRVGRTARAGQRGWSYSLVKDADIPYLIDLQLFLSRKLVVGQADSAGADFASDVVVGTLMKNKVEENCEWVNKIVGEDSELAALQSVASKGERLYLKSRNSASLESARRSRPITSSAEWTNLHPLFTESSESETRQLEEMLARVSGFKPPETIFEIGRRGAGGEAAEIMKKRRSTMDAARRKRLQLGQASAGLEGREGSDLQPMDAKFASGNGETPDLSIDNEPPALDLDVSSASSDELEVTVSDAVNPKKGLKSDFKDDAFFMSYQPSGTNAAEERAYGVHAGSSANDRNFITAARSATMDLTNDEGGQGLAEPTSMARMRWDKKAKKYVARANDEDGSKGVKYIRGESGQKIAASFRSGRFDAWKRANRVKGAPRVGENESPAIAGRAQSQQLGGGPRKWRHKKDEAPKDADKYRDDFHKRKKRVDEAKEARRGKFREGSGKNEIKTADTVRKERKAKERLKLKNGRGKKGSKARA